MTSDRIEQLRSRLKTEPSNPDRIELAKLLTDQAAARPEAREYCFAALADEPGNIQCRVLLARLFYLDGYTEYAIREVVEACRRRPLPSLHRLLEGFGQAAAPYVAALAGVLAAGATTAGKATVFPATPAAVKISDEEDSEVAEIDLDADILDILDELNDESDN